MIYSQLQSFTHLFSLPRVICDSLVANIYSQNKFHSPTSRKLLRICIFYSLRPNTLRLTMAMPVRMKRMLKERLVLEKPNPDYFVQFKDGNVLELEAYIYGAPDSLYRHKVLKFKITIPKNYPFEPPEVHYVQHGKGRVHPNLYVDGKVCLSILGTWPGEKWSQAMTIETVLISIRSLLDRQSFTHEPNQRDDPNYNLFVEYATWNLHLFDHLQHESDPVFRAFLNHYLQKNGEGILSELRLQATRNASLRQVVSRYERTTLQVDYPALIAQLTKRIEAANLELVELLDKSPKSSDIVEAIERLNGDHNSAPSKPSIAAGAAPSKGSQALANKPVLKPSKNGQNVYHPQSPSPDKRKHESIADDDVQSSGPSKKAKPGKGGIIDLT